MRIITSQLVLVPKYNQNDQVKEDEMGRACSTHGEKGVSTVLWQENLMEKHNRKI
jgi:hypothetical protein